MIYGWSTTAYLDYGTGTPYNPTYVSVSAWLYPTASSANYAFISKWNATSNYRQYYASMNATTRTVVFAVSSNGTNQAFVTTADALALNTWSLFTGTYDGTTIRAYINGVESGTPTTFTSGLAGNRGASLVIGSWKNGATWQAGFPGSIFDAREYGRALSAGECAGIYSARGRDGITADLLLRTCAADILGSLSSAKVYDYSATHNHITATGSLTAGIDPYSIWAA